jgi:hypothetical protein
MGATDKAVFVQFLNYSNNVNETEQVAKMAMSFIDTGTPFDPILGLSGILPDILYINAKDAPQFTFEIRPPIPQRYVKTSPNQPDPEIIFHVWTSLDKNFMDSERLLTTMQFPRKYTNDSPFYFIDQKELSDLGEKFLRDSLGDATTWDNTQSKEVWYQICYSIPSRLQQNGPRLYSRHCLIMGQ